MKNIELINNLFQIEEWKDIEGYSNYQVSNKGRVRSKQRTIEQYGHKKNYKRTIPGKILKPRRQNGGYLLVWLSYKGEKKALTVHRLVATAFIGKNDKLDVNHKDGNKQNNCVENLEFVTRSENIKHDYRVLRHSHNSCRVMCIDTNEIFNSIKESGRKTNTNPTSIGHALSGLNKTAGGKKWQKI